MPAPTMLDLARAEHVLGNPDDVTAVARYMSLNGTSLAAGFDVAEHQEPAPVVVARPTRSRRAVHPRTHPVTTECELLCSMCSKTGDAGERQCRWCGGCMVVLTVA
jgi:hypothetical protein